MSTENAEWLVAVSQQIRLDVLAVDICTILRDSGIPHVVIKGVTTARWLYDPPRAYRDVDILIPPEALPRCVQALVAAGVARASDARLGEEASHSYLLMSTAGAEIDIHVTLPTMDAATGGAVWQVLQDHVTDLELEAGTVPALTCPARCVVLAMHVLASGRDSDQVAEDFRRAMSAQPDIWPETLHLAADLGLSEEVRAAVDFISHGRAGGPSGAALRLAGASAAAIQFDRLREANVRRRLAILREELLPSTAFMHRYDPRSSRSRTAMIRARFGRLGRIARTLPTALREVRRARS